MEFIVNTPADAAQGGMTWCCLSKLITSLRWQCWFDRIPVLTIPVLSQCFTKAAVWVKAISAQSTGRLVSVTWPARTCKDTYVHCMHHLCYRCNQRFFTFFYSGHVFTFFNVLFIFSTFF